jgi:MFS family permease
MGAEWPAGAALAMESWPARSRGLMSGLLQGSWGLGFLMSSLAYGLLYDVIGWRGLLILGVLPALTVVWIRIYVKEPKVWVENRRIQREQHKEFKAPLLDIFRPRILPNTLMACLWMASGFVIYYSVYGMFATPPAKGSASEPRHGGNADRAIQSGWVPGDGLLGLCRRRARAQMGDDHPGGNWHAGHAVLSDVRFLRAGVGRLHRARRLPGRDLWTEPGVPERALSD